jgi:hypothetical protein
MKTTRLLFPILLAPMFLTTACRSSSSAPSRPAEIVQAQADPDTCDVCSSYVEIDLDTCVCADGTAPSGVASAPLRAPRPLAGAVSPSGSSLTVQLWSDPANCIPCVRLERQLPATFYCDGADVTITYVRNCGRNPKGGVIPTATINGQTVSGTGAILNLIQSEIGSLPCD